MLIKLKGDTAAWIKSLEEGILKFLEMIISSLIG